LEAPLKDETISLIADRFEEMLEVSGLSAAELLEALLEAPVSAEYRKLLRIGYKAGWKSILKAKLKSQPEPSKEKVAEVLAHIQAFKSVPHKLRTVLKQKVKEMPHPPGGRTRKIKLEEERTVCAEITTLRAECDTRQAIRRVAVKRKVSERTVYRIWGKYNPKKKQTSPKP
jgi:hypothetical protein